MQAGNRTDPGQDFFLPEGEVTGLGETAAEHQGRAEGRHRRQGSFYLHHGGSRAPSEDGVASAAERERLREWARGTQSDCLMGLGLYSGG